MKDTTDPANSGGAAVPLTIALVSLVIAGFLGFLYLQYRAASHQMRELNIVREALIMEINKGQTLRARKVEFEAELDRLNAILQELRVRLPEEPEMDRFLAALPAWVEGSSLKLLTATPAANSIDREYYRTTFVEVHVQGTEEQATHLLRRWAELPRCVQVDGFTPEGPDTFVLGIYPITYRDSPASPRKNPCDAIPQYKSVWPFQHKVEVLREDVEEKCGQRAKLETEIRQVDQLERLRNEVIKRNHLVEDLTSENPTPE